VCVCVCVCVCVRVCVYAWHLAYVYLSLLCACNVHVQADAQVREVFSAASAYKWWENCLWCVCASAHGFTHARLFCVCATQIMTLLCLLPKCSTAWAAPALLLAHTFCEEMCAISSLWGKTAEGVPHKTKFGVREN